MIKSFPVVELETGGHSLRRFRDWAARFGMFRLGRSLGVDPRTVRRYASGHSRPDPEVARIILALSQVEPLDGMPLTYEDLYGPARARKVETRTVRKAKPWE